VGQLNDEKRMIRRLFSLVLIILGTIAALLVITIGLYLSANRTNGTLVSSGEERAYLLYVPESYEPSKLTPLVISLHGLIQWPANQMKLTHWNDLAERYGFIVVYPSGTHFPLRWDAGGALPGAAGPKRDVLFISDLIEKLEGEYNIDPSRIYANGMSNGGGMTLVLSCQLAEKIAAVGMVAGAYFYPWEECDPVRQVPAVVFHGTDDPIVPFLGGTSRRYHITFPSITDWIENLARRNGCDAIPEGLPSSGNVSAIRYGSCAADVVFYTIAGGGHTWPGGERLPRIITGYTTSDIDATEAMWDFFQQNPLTNP
jgi:polyhydroxybutyrate depolymerase